MTTAQTLINDAADLAGVKAQGQDISGGRNARYLRALNRMIAAWRTSGVDLGVSTLAAGDTVYIDSEDEEAIEYNLAARIYEIESRPVNPSIYGRAQELKSNLDAKYLDVSEMELESSLIYRGYFDING